MKSFNQFINENEGSELDDLDFLKDLGMINPIEYAVSSKKLGLVQSIMDEVFASEQYKKMIDAGLVLDSGLQQLKNGTLVFTKPGATKRLGIFPIGFVRRMFLRGDHGQDAKIKMFDESGVNLYLVAMEWILENIDLNNPELLTKKLVKGRQSAAEKLPIVARQVYEEYAKYGFSPREVKLLGVNIYDLRSAADEKRTAKKYLKLGIIPYQGYFHGSRSENTEMIYDVLPKPGFRWIKLTNPTYISVYRGSERIWDNFDLDSQVEYAQDLGRYRDIFILFEDESQIEQYREVFNNYQPVRGVNIVPRVGDRMVS